MEMESEKLDKSLTRITGLSVGLFENGVAFLFLFLFTYLLSYARPPISLLFLAFNNTVIILVFYLFPLVTISCIEIGWYFHYRKSKKIDNGHKLVPVLPYYIVPMFLVLYLPLTMIEWVSWALTVFGLYVGFGKERFPLIKYGTDVYRVEWHKFNSTKKSVKNVWSSQITLLLSLSVFSLMVLLKIYPVPFLLIFYVKYYFLKIYFDNEEDGVFYKRWERFEDTAFMIVLWIAMILYGIVLVISIIIVGLNR